MKDFSVDLIIWLQETGGRFFELFWNAVSLLGEEYFYIIVLASIYWAFNKKMGEFLAVSLGIGLSLNNALKNLFMRPRPFEQGEPGHGIIENRRPDTATGSAFPSGHTQGASTLFFSIAVFLNKWKWYVLAAVVTVLMMFSRLALGVHYVEDVVVGGLLGVGVAFGHAFVFAKYKDNDESLHRYYSILAIVFMPGIFYFQGVEAADFYKAYGLLIGIIIALAMEKKHINFRVDVPWTLKLLRIVVGLVVVAGTLVLLGLLFGLFGLEEESWFFNLLQFVRYGIVAYTGFFIFPGIFHRLGK